MGKVIRQINVPKIDIGLHIIAMVGGCSIFGLTLFGNSGIAIGALSGLVLGILTREK